MLLRGDIELNPGPSSGHWAAMYTALSKGLVQYPAGCTQPCGDGLQLASFNIGGPTVDLERLVTIVQLLSDRRLDIVRLQEVKPTFPNIAAATALTFPGISSITHTRPGRGQEKAGKSVSSCAMHFLPT